MIKGVRGLIAVVMLNFRIIRSSLYLQLERHQRIVDFDVHFLCSVHVDMDGNVDCNLESVNATLLKIFSI